MALHAEEKVAEKAIPAFDLKLLGDTDYKTRRAYLFRLKMLDASFDVDGLLKATVVMYKGTQDMETKLLLQELIEHYFFTLNWDTIRSQDTDYYYGGRLKRLKKTFRTFLEYFYEENDIRTTLDPIYRAETLAQIPEDEEEDNYYNEEEE
jgi:hypothetical protein